MAGQADLLIERWNIAFWEMPAPVDIELIKTQLAEHGREVTARPGRGMSCVGAQRLQQLPAR